MLEGFNPDTIKDLAGGREAIFRLLNLVEVLKTQVEQLQAENQNLRDENNRLKGEQGQPDIKANKKKSQSGSSNYSSEKERRKPKRRCKQSKNDKIKIDREQVLDVEADILPEDAEFKGYDEVVVQDLKIKTDNVRFRKKKYYSPAQGQSYTAPLPLGYDGQFGPMLKSWVIVMNCWLSWNTHTSPCTITRLNWALVNKNLNKISALARALKMAAKFGIPG